MRPDSKDDKSQSIGLFNFILTHFSFTCRFRRWEWQSWHRRVRRVYLWLTLAILITSMVVNFDKIQWRASVTRHCGYMGYQHFCSLLFGLGTLSQKTFGFAQSTDLSRARDWRGGRGGAGGGRGTRPGWRLLHCSFICTRFTSKLSLMYSN